ncbi:MAG TPA: low-specificity L-threonine aldolase [Candidatus Tectomicrobia bacterium]|nr:low-specificity L-threonine aldolase [Candidatus Tectomicrobia bacterium]
MPELVDLRSDTVTKPSLGMRKAMAEAEVGDDVYHEDPSVNRLEAMVAALYGKEAALYVASGTMANQLAIRAQTHHGDEVIMERTSHPFNSEAGALAALAGVQVNLIDGKRGLMEVEQIKAVVRTPNVHHAPTALICLENTHNRGGGSIWPLDTIRTIREFAHSVEVPMHLDGARLMNACVATGLTPKDYAQYFDSCTLCLSKGLGAPVGSLVIGSKDFIARAHRFRKQFGGGMRQAGILAAAGIYALEHNVERLAEDHLNAKRLAKGIAEIDGLDIDEKAVETNILFFHVRKPGLTVPMLLDRMKAEGVLMGGTGPNTIRAVSHLDVSKDGIDRAIEVLRKVVH